MKLCKTIVGITLLLCWCVLAHAEDLSKHNKPLTLRVLLAKLNADAVIEIKGPFHAYHLKSESLIETGTHKKKCSVYALDKGLFCGEKFPDIYELRFVPISPKTRIIVDGIPYKGCMEIYAIGGTINIVNEIDAENFLKSTLSAKIGEKLSRETLDAIAITERTHLYYLMQKASYASWQLEAEKMGYLGCSAKFNPSAQEAVERTRDMILNYCKQPFPAEWGYNHAGKSVSYISIFRKKGSTPIGVQQLPSLAMRDKAKWKTAISTKMLAEMAGLSFIKEIDLFKAEKSTKVYGVRLSGPEGKRDIDFFTLQKALGPQLLQSNDFKILTKGKKVYFVGYGKGLGVGLCATSAELMVKNKEPVESILTHHFPQTSLVNVREELGLPHEVNPIWK